jgi:hypothetical protein
MMSANSVSTKPDSRGRLAVVSGFGHNSMAPRGQRTQNLVAELSARWDVELLALPPDSFTASDAAVSRKPLWRRAIKPILHSVALDRCEAWAIRHFRRWRPEVDAALLIAYPWSPVTRAASRLGRSGIPYVVDAGDPWVLTEAVPLPRTISIWRSKRAELQLWKGASGAVVTTRQQGDRLEQMFPHLQILVRPNGYTSAAPAALPAAPPPREPGSLRLAHFGTLSPVRVDIGPILAAAQRSGRWSTISFSQFGDDYVGMLGRVPKGIRVERHAARPWAEIAAAATEFDAAVVLGNQLGYLLPSKAIQYLTLPIPRLAVTGGKDDDALADFAAAQPGWLVVSAAQPQPQLAEQLAEHVERDWSTQELAPPPSESWPEVAAEVGAFVERCVRGDDVAPVPTGESAPLARRAP